MTCDDANRIYEKEVSEQMNKVIEQAKLKSHYKQQREKTGKSRGAKAPCNSCSSNYLSDEKNKKE